jgi:hypothetical protein
MGASPVLLAYNTSKTAANASAIHYARELADTPILVNAVPPATSPPTSTTTRAFLPPSKPHTSPSTPPPSPPTGRPTASSPHNGTGAAPPRRDAVTGVLLSRIRGSTGDRYNGARDFRTRTNRAVGTPASCRRSESRGVACRSTSVHDQERPELSLLRAVCRSFVSIRRVVEVGLDRRRRAAETLGDLGDREALSLTEVVRKGDRSAAFYDAVIPRRRQTGRHTVEVLAGSGWVSDSRPVIR